MRVFVVLFLLMFSIPAAFADFKSKSGAVSDLVNKIVHSDPFPSDEGLKHFNALMAFEKSDRESYESALGYLASSPRLDVASIGYFGLSRESDEKFGKIFSTLSKKTNMYTEIPYLQSLDQFLMNVSSKNVQFDAATARVLADSVLKFVNVPNELSVLGVSVLMVVADAYHVSDLLPVLGVTEKILERDPAALAMNALIRVCDKAYLDKERWFLCQPVFSPLPKLYKNALAHEDELLFTGPTVRQLESFVTKVGGLDSQSTVRYLSGEEVTFPIIFKITAMDRIRFAKSKAESLKRFVDYVEQRYAQYQAKREMEERLDKIADEQEKKLEHARMIAEMELKLRLEEENKRRISYQLMQMSLNGAKRLGIWAWKKSTE